MNSPFGALPTDNQNSPQVAWSLVTPPNASTFQVYPAITTVPISYGYGEGGYGDSGYGGIIITPVVQAITQWTVETTK